MLHRIQFYSRGSLAHIGTERPMLLIILFRIFCFVPAIRFSLIVLLTLTSPNTVSCRAPWGGASDHIPVITVTSTKTCTTPHSRLPPHISTKLLSSIVHREKAENLYEEVIPKLTADMEIAESREELERIYAEFKNILFLKEKKCQLKPNGRVPVALGCTARSYFDGMG